MTFFNINTIYNAFSENIGLPYIAIGISLVVSVILGFYVYFTYKLTIKNSFHQKDFNNILPGISIITCVLMIVMNSNIIVFLGIISAISLIRFRHTLKNPLDLLFLFWALCIGIFSAVQLYYIAFLVSAFITVLFFFFNTLSLRKASYILTVVSNNDIYDELYEIIKKQSNHVIQKKVSHLSDSFSYTFSLKTKKEDILMEQINKIPSLKSISFTSYNGEYREN